MKVLIIVSAFLLVQVYGKAINAKCEPALFNSCTDTFAKALGLSAMPSDASVLDKQIKQLEAQGKQDQVCTAAGNLQNCLGAEFNDCMSVAFLKSIGESDADAKEFVAISQQLEKQCSQIHSNVINAKCELSLFNRCTDTFAQALGLPSMPSDARVLDKQIKQLETQGKQAQVCKAAGDLQNCLGAEYSDCISVAFLKSIGESDADAKEFVAISQQLEKQSSQIHLNRANDKCKISLFFPCTTTFAKALGLPYMSPDPSVLDNQIKLLKAQGKQAQICKAAGDLQRCLGAEFSDCMTVRFLNSVGESDADAKKFVAISQQVEKQCFSAPNDKCDPALFNTCTDTFAKALGLPSMPTDASVLDNRIKQLIAQGKQVQVCKAAGDLQHCLGAEYNDCMTVAFLKSIGESDADAKEFVAISQQLEKKCVQIHLNAINAKCEIALFTRCSDTFAKALGLPSMPTDASVLANQIKQLVAQGKQAQVCKAAGDFKRRLGEEYSDCMSVAFLKSIGESDADAKEFVAMSQKMEQKCVHIHMNVINTKCDPILFDTCTETFALALGLPAMPTDASVLDRQIKQLEAIGKQAQVCKAAENLQGCLGAQYDDCLSVAFLKSIGESDKDAKEFVAISDQLKKQCVQIRFNAANDKCEVARFNTCTDTFAKALGLPSMPTDASILDKQIKELEAQGKLAQVCKADRDLQSCLGAEYGDCLFVAFLKSIGESDADAKKFVEISHQLEIKCVQIRFNAANDKCEVARFNTCTDTFAKALGLPSMPTDASVLDKQIKQLVAQGKQVQVCLAAGNLQNCLGSEFNDCMSVAFLKSIGESDADAKEFVAISQELEKKCVQ